MAGQDDCRRPAKAQVNDIRAKYSGNLMITGYIGNVIGPRQAIVGSCRFDGGTYARLGAQIIGTLPFSG